MLDCSKCLPGHFQWQWCYRAQLFKFSNKKQTLKETTFSVRVGSPRGIEPRQFVLVLLTAFSKSDPVVLRLTWWSGMMYSKENGQSVKDERGGVKAGHNVDLGIGGKGTKKTWVRNE